MISLGVLLGLLWGLLVFWVVISSNGWQLFGARLSPPRRFAILGICRSRVAVGIALFAGVLMFGVPIVVGAIGSWYLLRWWRGRVEKARRRKELHAAMPEMVELLSVALYGGLGLQEACVAVSGRIDGALGDELRRCVRHIEHGQRFDDALVEFRDRAGSPYRGVVSAILATQRYGLPLAATLERLGSEARAERRRLADARTRRLPVQMLFPLVLLFLPSVLLIVVVPVLGAALSQLVSVA